MVATPLYFLNYLCRSATISVAGVDLGSLRLLPSHTTHVRLVHSFYIGVPYLDLS